MTSELDPRSYRPPSGREAFNDDGPHERQRLPDHRRVRRRRKEVVGFRHGKQRRGHRKQVSEPFL